MWIIVGLTIFWKQFSKKIARSKKNEQRFNCVLQNQQLEAFLVEKMDKLKLLGLLFYTKNVTYSGQNTKKQVAESLAATLLLYLK
jgi:hypothetical protein